MKSYEYVVNRKKKNCTGIYKVIFTFVDNIEYTNRCSDSLMVAIRLHIISSIR